MVEAAKLAANLTFSESECWLTLTRNLANEERAKAATEEAAVERKKAKVIEDRAARVVEYKSSTAFRDDVTDISMDVFVLDFEEYKKLVAEMFPELDLRSITVSGGEEEDGAAEEMEEGELLAITETTQAIGAGEEVDGDEVMEVPPPTVTLEVVDIPPPTAPSEVVEVVPSTAEVLALAAALDTTPKGAEVPPSNVAPEAIPE